MGERLKIFVVHTMKWLGPGTPYTGIVKEQDEHKAIEAFMDPYDSPFEQDNGKPHFTWYERYRPSVEDFMAKCIGYDNVWPSSFPDHLRDPNINKGPVYSSEESVCRLFMKDRIVIRVYTERGAISGLMFSTKLALADFFYGLSMQIGDKSKEKVVDLAAAK